MTASGRISVVIRALNEAEHLPSLLEALRAQTLRPDEVILVDSGSTDATVEIASAHGARIVSIAPEDFTFGRSLNVGCAAAAGDILVLASAHVAPTDDRWLENLVSPFRDEGVVLSYGKQRGDHRTKFSETRLMQSWFPDESDDAQRSPFCNNANCAIRRSWWEVIPYNEDLTGLEDLDWAQRAQSAGGRIVYRADARVIHVHQERWGQTRNRYRREAIALKQIMPDQHLTRVDALRLFVETVARDLAAASRQRVLLRNLLAIPAFRSAQYLGASDGFRQRGEVSEELRMRFYYPSKR